MSHIGNNQRRLSLSLSVQSISVVNRLIPSVYRSFRSESPLGMDLTHRTVIRQRASCKYQWININSHQLNHSLKIQPLFPKATNVICSIFFSKKWSKKNKLNENFEKIRLSYTHALLYNSPIMVETGVKQINQMNYIIYKCFHWW